MAGAALAVSIIALALTCLGWFVNSWLNVRAQRQALVNSLTNDARITLIDAIREFHEWCIEIKLTARGMPIDDITSGGQITEHHERRRRKIAELSIESRHFIWLRRLEEYEPLFPGTTPVRADLLNRLMAVCTSARTLADKHAPGSPPSEEELDRFDEEVTDILVLTWDLLIYVQNVSIGKITGNAITERQPLDSHSIRLISDQRGWLSVNQPRQKKA